MNVLGLSILPSLHPENSYPSSGMAVTTSEVPEATEPPVISVVPPLDEDIVKL